MTFEEISSRFKISKRYSNRVQAICPAHADAHASLTITRGERGTLVHCHAGCRTEDILEAVGLKKQDLFYESSEKKSVADWISYVEGRENRRIEAVYDYYGLGGDYRFTKVRLEGKRMLCGILQNGRFTYGLGGRSRKDLKAVYGNLRAIQGVISRGERVFYAEGERDIDTLARKGFIGLTAGGVNDWQPEFAELFRGANVIILADNDPPGQKLAQIVLDDIQGIAASARIIIPMPTIPHGDVSDYLQNHTGDDFLAMIQELVVTEKAPIPTRDKKTNSEIDILVARLQQLDAFHRFPMNDRGNAELYAAVFGTISRYCPIAKDFMTYDGIRWRPDVEGMKARSNAKLLADAAVRYAAAIEADDKAKMDYLRHTARLMDYRARTIMLNDSKDLSYIDRAELDTNDFLINAQNCVVDLSGNEPKALEHDPGLLLSKVCGAAYEPEATCPLWISSLNEIMEGDQGKIDFLQKLLGLALTGCTREEKMFIFFGATSRNGKSTVCETAISVLGEYATTISPETLAIKRNADSRNASPDIAKLNGVRLVIASEPPKRILLDTSLLKTMTGRDTITARFLHENEFEFMPKFKLFLNSNYLPIANDLTIFKSGRISVLPFNKHFSEAEQDKNLKEKLLQERNGIFQWMIRGWFKYRMEGLEPPESIKESTQEYAADSDKIGRFIDETLIKTPGQNISAKQVYDLYAGWCDDAGFGVENKSNFFSELKSRGLFAATATVSGKTVKNAIRGYSIVEEEFITVTEEKLPFD